MFTCKIKGIRMFGAVAALAASLSACSSRNTDPQSESAAILEKTRKEFLKHGGTIVHDGPYVYREKESPAKRSENKGKN